MIVMQIGELYLETMFDCVNSKPIYTYVLNLKSNTEIYKLMKVELLGLYYFELSWRQLS